MTAQQKYTTAAGLRMALEERLKQIARMENQDIMRLRNKVAFDRFLARLFSQEGLDVFALKGGYSLELRLRRARTTKDIDLAINDRKALIEISEESIRALIQKNLESDLGDFFNYSIGTAILDLENAPYGGYRFPVDCSMAGRRFTRFNIDVAVGDAWIEPHETINLHDWLEFAGISSPAILAISPEQQFAEKLHSYTLPRQTQNSRTKDLVDMHLLIENTKMHKDRLNNAVIKTFQKRRTHEIPSDLEEPPKSWEKQFTSMTAECGISSELNDAFEIVRKFCIAHSIF